MEPTTTSIQSTNTKTKVHMESNYDPSWVDDERGPLHFTTRVYEKDGFVHITQLTKEITRALDEMKWSTQWNESEWKNPYYEGNYYGSSSDDEYSFNIVADDNHHPQHVDLEDTSSGHAKQVVQEALQA